MPTVRLIIGDVRDVISQMIADGDTFDQLITSPPFLALRSYLPADHPDKHREIGSEPTPATFLDTLYGLTADWGRLLPEWGSLCVELGDTMSGSGGAGGDYNADGLREGQAKFDGSAARATNPGRSVRYQADGYTRGISARARQDEIAKNGPGWPLAKSMCILPHAYTLGLAYGLNPLTGQPSPAGQWRIRNVITWARPNPPVGSLGKRNPVNRTGDYKFRPACSYITVACRGTGRYFDLDAVRTEAQPGGNGGTNNQKYGGDDYRAESIRFGERINSNPAGAPPLDWHSDQLDGDWLWKLATAPYPGAHYATYPLTLPRRLILAMCPELVCLVCGWPRERIVHMDSETRLVNRHKTGFSPRDGREEGWLKAPHFDSPSVTTLGFTDCGHDNYRPGRVLDPFGGSGTTAVAAALEGRDCTLIDLDPRNVALVDRRLREALHVTSYEVDGNVHTWTLEAPLPAQKQQVDGQTNLFDLEPVPPKPYDPGGPRERDRQGRGRKKPS